MRLVAALVVIAACGAAPPRPRAQRPTLASAFGDAAAFEHLVRGSITVGGLWFADPTCQEFAVAQEVTEPRIKGLARCLATLPLVESKRIDALEDVRILTYAPGFEIEARVIFDGDGARLAWIGYEAARDDRDRTPTISSAALESLRTAGEPNGGLEPAVVARIVREVPAREASRVARAWFKICLDATGNIVNIDPRQVTSLGARDAFLAAANAWAFRPFTANGAPVAVCAMTQLVAPSDVAPVEDIMPFPPPPSQNGTHPLMIPPTMLVRRTGESLVVPDDVTKLDIQRGHISRLTGTFRVCIDRTGQVESVLPYRPTGVPAYDRKIELRVRGWTYQPFIDGTGPVPVCTSLTFNYLQS